MYSIARVHVQAFFQGAKLKVGKKDFKWYMDPNSYPGRGRFWYPFIQDEDIAVLEVEGGREFLFQKPVTFITIDALDFEGLRSRGKMDWQMLEHGAERATFLCAAELAAYGVANGIPTRDRVTDAVFMAIMKEVKEGEYAIETILKNEQALMDMIEMAKEKRQAEFEEWLRNDSN